MHSFLNMIINKEESGWGWGGQCSTTTWSCRMLLYIWAILHLGLNGFVLFNNNNVYCFSYSSVKHRTNIQQCGCEIDFNQLDKSKGDILGPDVCREIRTSCPCSAFSEEGASQVFMLTQAQYPTVLFMDTLQLWMTYIGVCESPIT